MTFPVLRLGVCACVMAATTVSHAATPVTLPFSDLGLPAPGELELPLPPPPPRVAKPDVARMRLVIKAQPAAARGGCEPDRTRRLADDKRQAAADRATSTRLG